MLEVYVQMMHLACCGSAFLKHLLKPTWRSTASPLQMLWQRFFSLLGISPYIYTLLMQKEHLKSFVQPCQRLCFNGPHASQIGHRHDIYMPLRVGQRVQNVSWFVDKNGCKIDSSMLWDWRDGWKKTLSLWRSLITALFTLHFLF